MANASAFTKTLENIQSIEDAETFLTERGITLQKNLTVTLSQLETFSYNFESYFRETNPLYRRTKIFVDVMRLAAPQRGQIFCMSKKIFDITADFFKDDRSSAILLEQYYQPYMSRYKRCVTKTEIDLYLRSVQGLHAVLPEFEEAPMIKEPLSVGLNIKNHASNIMWMMESILANDRSLQFGGANTDEQKTKIDPIWLTFFTVHKLCHLTWDQFKAFQRGIYVVGLTIRGKAGTIGMITGLARISGFGDLTARLSQSNNNFKLPPWILSASRVDDLVAVLGACDNANDVSTLKNPAISWRYLLSLQLSSEKTVGLLYILWITEQELKRPTGGDNDFSKAESAFQHIIQGKGGPLACTNFFSGNGCRINLI